MLIKKPWKLIMKTWYSILIISLLALPVSAQDTLQLYDAIKLSLEQNYDIVVARNDAAVADNNANPGSAGLLPTVTANGGVSYSIGNTNQKFAGGIPDKETNGAQSTNYNAGVGLNYTLFDGLGNVYTLKKLNTLANMSEVQSRLLIETTVLQVVSGYLEVARLADTYRISLESLQISLDRFNRLKEKYDYGSATKLDVLNAEVDLNADSVSLLTNQAEYDNAKRSLNLLLGRPADTEFDVSLDVELNDALALQDIRDNAASNNAALVVASQSMMSAKYDVKLAKSTLAPNISGSASYGYSKSVSDAGILLENQNLGFTGGLTLTWNLFAGKQRLVQIQNAQLNLESSQQRYDQALNQVDRDVLNAFTTYQNSLYVLRMDRQNLETAQLNFDRSKDLYDLGQLTSTQFREAQLNLIYARQRITLSTFTAKLAEIELLRLGGSLLANY